jgi:hypothetical protein
VIKAKYILGTVATMAFMGSAFAAGASDHFKKAVADVKEMGGRLQAGTTINVPSADASSAGHFTIAGVFLSNHPVSPSTSAGPGDTALTAAVGFGPYNGLHGSVFYNREDVSNGNQQSAGVVLAHALPMAGTSMAVHVGDIMHKGKGSDNQIDWAVAVSKFHRFLAKGIGPHGHYFGVTVTAGAGNGALAYDSALTQVQRENKVGAFAALAVSPLDGVSLIADYTKHADSYGISVAPFIKVPLTCTLSHMDVTGKINNSNGPSNAIACAYTVTNDKLAKALSFGHSA